MLGTGSDKRGSLKGSGDCEALSELAVRCVHGHDHMGTTMTAGCAGADSAHAMLSDGVPREGLEAHMLLLLLKELEVCGDRGVVALEDQAVVELGRPGQ